MTFVTGTAAGAFWISFWTPTVGMGCHSGGYMIFVVIAVALFIGEMTAWFLLARDSILRIYADGVLTMAEAVNTIWLLYITIAQTYGLYETCDCKGAIWDSLGGYIDFSDPRAQVIYSVYPFWLTGTLFACVVVIWGTGFVVLRWCEQSHLTTLDYDNAVRGLMRTRRFMNYTKYIR
jgi:hypothetical protein